MNRWKRWAVTGVFALAVIPSAAGTAVAQVGPNASETAKQKARALADQGYVHYEAKEYAKAIPYFRDAESTFHAVSLLVIWAHCHAALGQLVQAEPLYQRVADEPLPENAPREFIDAQTEANTALANIQRRIATLKITLKGTTPDAVTITIDDVEIPKDKVLQPLKQNPGAHRVVATLGSGETGRSVFQNVTLKEGTTKQIQIVFRPGDPKPTTPPAAGGCASCEIGRPAASDGPWAFVGLGLALAAALRRKR